MLSLKISKKVIERRVIEGRKLLDGTEKENGHYETERLERSSTTICVWLISTK